MFRAMVARTAVPLQARAVFPSLPFSGFVVLDSGTAVPPQARAVPTFLVNRLQFFHIIFGQIPTKQIKITQNKQNKGNKTRGLPPTKRSFIVTSLTKRSESFLKGAFQDLRWLSLQWLQP